MGAEDVETGLHAGARMPSRLDSVPAARAFLMKLLHGWSLAAEVIDDAALLTTEIMANALEHGDGLVSVEIALDEGVLQVRVGDNADQRQPKVQSVDTHSPGGRGMWIVDIVARDWGTEATLGQPGKTVWFELVVEPAPHEDARALTSAVVPMEVPAEAMSPSPPSARKRTLPALKARGSYAYVAGTQVVIYEDKLSAMLGEFARTLLTDFPIQAILDRLVARIVEAMPMTAVGVTLISPTLGAHYVAASNPQALEFQRMQTTFTRTPSLQAYEAGEAVEIADIQLEHRFPQFVSAAPAAGVAASFAFPLRHNDTRLGALDLYRDIPGPLSSRDLDTAQTLADVTAAYVINAQAREAAQQSSDRYREDAFLDPLTGLVNRMMLHQRLRGAAERAERTNCDVAVLFADLDRFKQVNDTYGHQIGDELLVAVADRLAALVRPGDTLARVSGDEFVILCENLKQADEIEVLAARIDDAFSRPFVLSTVELMITASVGMAYAGPGDSVTHQLIVNADIAMYQAKRNGGAGHQIIDLREATRSTDRSGLEQDLHAAFSRKELDLAYQPIVRSSDGLVTGAEALLRWTHALRGPVSPLDIVRIAETNGLINPIGAWVLEQACRERAHWLDLGRPLSIAVNVSARQLMSRGFCATVAEVMERTRMDPGALVLEITEGIFIRDGDLALTVLSQLKTLGLRLALDDFGTGYSSLSYLRQFPVDILKIDRSFVPEIETDRKVAAIAAAITTLARVLDLSVVAEGVETLAQRDEITAVGCDSAQGYYYAKPMSAHAFTELLTSSPDGIGPFLPQVAALDQPS